MEERGFDTRIDADTNTIVVTGSLDDAEEFSRVVLSRVELPAATTTVDLSAVTFFPSSALGVLVQARKVARRSDGTLRVTSDDGSIASRVLQVSGFPTADSSAAS